MTDPPEAKKRQHNSFNCPECNLTFDTKYKMNKHLREHNDGKTLSPERKIAKMNHHKGNEEDPKEVEEKKKELENLQDLLLQTGKEKEEFNIRLSKSNENVLCLEKANEALTKEINYMKVESQKSDRNLNDLDKEYSLHIRDLRKREAQKDHEIVFLKAENEKSTRDLNTLDDAYKAQVIELKKSSDQKDIEIKIKNDQLRKNGLLREEEDKSAELHISLEALVVTNSEAIPEPSSETSSKTSSEAISLTAPQHTPETTPREEQEAALEELVTLAAGKAAGHVRETPQIQPTNKKEQHHCALSGRTSEILCTFQCDSKIELDKHIKDEHRIFPCADRSCTVECTSLDKLAKHVTTVHKREENTMSAYLTCNICEFKCQAKVKLMEHIKTHRSYKLCKKYAVNKCEVESECRYGHVILPPGVQICYKCGVTTSSKTDLIKHIKSKHGAEICHNFLANKCDFEKCMFSHIVPSAQSVEKIPERKMATPSAPTEEDFLNLPTTGPVVRTEPRAQQEQETTSLYNPRSVLWSSILTQQPITVPRMSEEAQNKIKKMATHVIESQIKELLPQILTKVIADLNLNLL